MKTHYYGHSCFSVEVDGKQLLFDPFISPNPAASTIDVDALRPDYILLSHGHEDHVADAVRIAKQSGAKVIACFEVVQWIGRQGVSNLHGMNHGGAYQFEFGRVKAVNAIHSSSMPDGSYGGNPAGYVIETPEKNFYYSGDTALHSDMKLIGEMTRLDWAALCVGDNYTMGAADAAVAAQFVGVKEVLGVHYDTFPEIKIDHAAAKKTFAQAGLHLHLPAIGESVEW